MHLFEAEAKEKTSLRRADASVQYLVNVQGCLTLFIDAPGCICRSCMGFAAYWAEGHCRKPEASAMLPPARAQKLRVRDAKRYRNIVEEADLEADRLLFEVREFDHPLSFFTY